MKGQSIRFVGFVMMVIALVSIVLGFVGIILIFPRFLVVLYVIGFFLGIIGVIVWVVGWATQRAESRNALLLAKLDAVYPQGLPSSGSANSPAQPPPRAAAAGGSQAPPTKIPPQPQPISQSPPPSPASPSGPGPERPPAVVPSRFCPYCGAQNSPDFSFCQKCGKALPTFT